MIGICLALLAAYTATTESNKATEALNQTKKLEEKIYDQNLDLERMVTNLDAVRNEVRSTVIEAQALKTELNVRSTELAKELDSVSEATALLAESAKQTESRSTEIANITKELTNNTEQMDSTIVDSINLLYSNMLQQLETSKTLLDLECSGANMAFGWDIGCNTRHVVFASDAVNTYKAFDVLTAELANKSRLDRASALEYVCENQPSNIEAAFPTMSKDIFAGYNDTTGALTFSEITDTLEGWATTGTTIYTELAELCKNR